MTLKTFKTFKTFKDFLKEDYLSSLHRKGLIDGNEINYYMEKFAVNPNSPFNINDYMATFMNHKKTVYDFLTNPFFGKPGYLRFLLVYYDNQFTMYIFNSYIRHTLFVNLLDDLSSSFSMKPIPVDYKTLYKNSYKRNFYEDDDLDAEKEVLNQLNTIWCLPGLYDGETIKTLSSRKYMELLEKLNWHKKLGFNDRNWSTLKMMT
jgi:hypothetical protein